MPKKTKKEKLRADTHRQPMHSHRDKVFTPTTPIPSLYTISQTTLKQPPRVEALHIEQTAIKRDIRNTIGWSVLIITGELLLSWYLK